MTDDAGATLPDFDLALSSGGRLRSDELRGGRTVLYFYPKDDTPGCTIEAHEFTELLPDFEKRGVRVFGVSPDSEKSHDRFVDKCSIGFPLVSDPEHRLIEPLGLWVEKSFAGKKYKGVERATYIVGADGAIEREWHAVKAQGHAREVLEAL